MSDSDGMAIDWLWLSDDATAVGTGTGSSVKASNSLSPTIELSSDTDEPDGLHKAQQNAQIPTCDGVLSFRLLKGFDTFWYFASERQQIENRRRAGHPPPWTKDRILQANKFTSIFRVADRGTQFLINEVIEKGSQDHEEILYRVLLFSTFMKIETYQLLTREFGPLTWARFDEELFSNRLKAVLRSGMPIYTGAFQKHAPKLGESTEHENHLKLLRVMMEDDMVNHLKGCRYMADAFDAIHRYPSFADFMSFQLLMNLSYTPILPFNENDFVIAGVGAVKGLAKCFAPEERVKKYAPSIIRWMMQTQDEHFARLGLTPAKLQGSAGSETRSMSLVDVEHTLCETHKYITALARGTAKARFVAPAAGAGGRGRALARYPKRPEAWSDPRRKEVRIKRGRSDKERPQKVYVVSQILERGEAEDGEVLYFVDWLGYGPEARTWESESTLKDDIPKVLAAYEKAHPRVDERVKMQKEKRPPGRPRKKFRRGGE